MPLFLKHTGRGEVELQEHPKPTPDEGQFLVKVEVAGGNPVDLELNSTVPIVGSTVGYDFAGAVESLGPSVSRFKPGDRVAGISFGHAIANTAWGAFGEYCIGWDYLSFKIPEGMSYEEAVTLPVGLAVTGLSLGDQLGLKEGADGPLLVVGGSTNMGAVAVQYAKAVGASPIVAVAGKKNEELVKSLGATHFVDYSLPDEEYIAKVQSVAPGLKKALDARSNEKTMFLCGKIIGSGGKIVVLNPPEGESLPRDVEYHMVNVFSVFGKDFNIFGMDMPADPAAKAFLEEWYPAVAQKLVVEGRIKPHGYRVIEGGLRGVKDGWKLYETNAVSAQKLVYRVGETKGLLDFWGQSGQSTL